MKWTDDIVDPGHREVDLPDPLPEVGDDFDWHQRDFESFRRAMSEELRERFPERTRWTAGDVEAVIIETLAAMLDQLSDMADRVSAEASLPTARRVESVLSWLDFINFDPCKDRGLSLEALKQLYQDSPQELERDRRRGPQKIRLQSRMVHADDYANMLERHPLVMRAYTKPRWNGSWMELVVTASLWNDWRLDHSLTLADTDPNERCIHKLPPGRRAQIESFHQGHGLRAPLWDSTPTNRELLSDYLRVFRLAGQSVFLADVVQVGLAIELCVMVRPNYFQSEIRREVRRVLGTGPDGFFRPGRLAAGQDVQLSDIYGEVMSLDGVAEVTLDRFGKLAENPCPGFIQQAIEIAPDEIALCDNKHHGRLTIRLRGGRRG